jgi:hypothetical protein
LRTAVRMSKSPSLAACRLLTGRHSTRPRPLLDRDPIAAEVPPESSNQAPWRGGVPESRSCSPDHQVKFTPCRGVQGLWTRSLGSG